ncbi:uncharacterized protein LOC110263805 [Arachis ipaensis]|uniref:uncharacterized protein LOC110263805 n=1 Tax=Arachis ipaensis TaxID=130454 RepID=UPI000A2B906A|nr:uncharacterized protein LOC110263805 [Arachis ipaensis]
MQEREKGEGEEGGVVGVSPPPPPPLLKERSARRGGRRPHLTTFSPPTRRHCTALPPYLCYYRTPSSTKGARHRFSESSIGTAVLTTADEAHRSCSKVIATLFGSIGRCTVAGVVAENCRQNRCLLGIVYRELLCCMSPSEPPFHCCRLCSEQFVVASIVVVAAARLVALL